MGQVAEFEKVRKKRSKARFVRRLIMLIVTVCAAVAGFQAAQVGTLRTATGRASDAMMAFLAGEALPVSLPVGRPRWAADVEGRIALADDASILVYTRAGRLLGSQVLGYKAPAFKAEGARILAYDVGGSRFGLFYWEKEIISVDTGESIYCADLSPGGLVAVGSSAASALSGVTVYAENKAQLFRWTSSEFVMSAVKLGAAGDKVAFSGIASEGGEVYSSVCLYKIDKENPVFRVPLTGEVVIGLEFFGNDIVAVSDRRVTLIGANGNVKSSYEYAAAPVAFVLSPKGEVGLVTGNYESSHKLTVTLLGAGLSLGGSWQVDGHIEQMGFANGRLYVVSDERFISFTRKEEPSMTRIPEGILALPAGELFYLTPSALKRAAG